MCFAQSIDTLQLSNYRIKKIATSSDTLIIDTFSIVPRSVFINNLDSSYYHINYLKSILIWKNKPQIDSITVSYRVFPFNFSKPFYNKSIDKFSTAKFENEYYNTENNNTPVVDFGEIDYNGGFSRAISFGNAQDAIVNSQFNLQLNGYLPDSILVTAAVTDNTIPFQPEGNTARIQEFDKIFIQLKRKNALLVAGDHELFRPNSYFMNYYKRVQGALFSNTNYIKDTTKYYRYSYGASLAKGKFTRNTFQGTEGNQGPYKLTGPNNETYMIIMANSERVTIDGITMQRGEEYDYIIDYNTAEIVFMPKQMITKDSRIIVEYEFNDRNFLNSMLFTSQEYKANEKLKFSFNFYNNQDAKNQPFLQKLDTAQKIHLASIGDNLSLANYASAQQVDTFNSNYIYYEMYDTTVNSIIYDSVYKYYTDTNAIRYFVNFSFVGSNNGNYIQSVSSANGRVYQWVAPINGTKQGNYEPVITLVTPKRQQLFMANATYTTKNKNTLFIETGFSNSDPNLFSSIDNNNHLGNASRLNYKLNKKINTKTLVQLDAYGEFVQNNFRQLDRFRNAEFNRDWTVLNPLQYENEKLAGLNSKIVYNKNSSIIYNISLYKRGSLYNGLRNNIGIEFKQKNWNILAFYNQTNVETNLFNSKFTRPSITIEKTLNNWKGFLFGTKCSLEHNIITDANKKYLPTSFAFDVASFYINSNDAFKNKYSLMYFTRKDKLTNDSSIKDATVSQNIQAQIDFMNLKNQNLYFITTFRSLQVLDTTLYKNKSEEGLLSRISYDANFWKGALNLRTLYEIGSGQELKREFTYVQVAAGQGTHFWQDYNNDALQQLNEFEIAQFPDQKLYIKVFTPTNEYVKAKYSIFNQSIVFNPRTFTINKKALFFKMLGKFYWQTNIQFNNKFLAVKGLQQYNPLYNSSDTNLISNSNTISNTLFINRYSSTWSLELAKINSENAALLSYGIDTRTSSEYVAKSNINYSKQFSSIIEYKNGNKEFNSSFLDGRNYNFDYYSIMPSLRWLSSNRKISMETNFKYEQKINAQNIGGQKAFVNSNQFNFQYNTPNSGNFNAKITYSNISYNAFANNSIAFIMLDGLQKGKNVLWRASFDKRISKTFEASLEYEGRKSETTNTIHTGRASARAIF